MEKILNQMEDVKAFREHYEECLLNEIEFQKQKKEDLKEKLRKLEEEKDSLEKDIAFDRARVKCHEEKIEFYENEFERLEGQLKVAKAEKNSIEQELEGNLKREGGLRISNAQHEKQCKELELLVKIYHELDMKSKRKISEKDKELAALRNENQLLKRSSLQRESKTQESQSYNQPWVLPSVDYSQWYANKSGLEGGGFREYFRPPNGPSYLRGKQFSKRKKMNKEKQSLQPRILSGRSIISK